MEEDDIAMRVGNSLVQRERRTDGGGRGCKPKGAYKEVPKDPLHRVTFITPSPTLRLVFQVFLKLFYIYYLVYFTSFY